MNFLIILILFSSVYSGLIDKLGGDFERSTKGLSRESQLRIRELLSGLDSSKIVDIHVHVVGNGSSGSGAWINPNLKKWNHFTKNFQYKIYLSASGIDDESKADEQAFAYLKKWINSFPIGGTFYLLAFDAYYNKDGSLDSTKTEFHIPNQYVWDLAHKDSRLETTVSIHPYRKDAIAQVRKWGQKGVRMIKWLPNAMGIDAADSSLIPFYQEVKKQNMIILTHVGEEKAVEAEEDQKYGNPLRFRLPLDLGVPVIMAHCASLGENQDLDDPKKNMRSAFSLFTRMMNNPKYDKLLFGDISAMTQFNRVGPPLAKILAEKSWHKRLIQGSDYPLPAVNALIRMKPLLKYGFITQADAKVAKEVYKNNPLLFDFILKRMLKNPQTGTHFAEEVFYFPEVLKHK